MLWPATRRTGHATHRARLHPCGEPAETSPDKPRAFPCERRCPNGHRAPTLCNTRSIGNGKRRREKVVRKVLEIGGCIAAVVLIGFGVGALVTGFNARST